MNKAKIHPSIRGHFAYHLHAEMAKNKKIYVLVGDLGYGMFDKIRDDFPKRFLNTGAAEQSGVATAIGLSLGGYIPIYYSITTFLLFRPFEAIRNYLHNSKIPVKLVGSGFGKDYKHDGYSHHPLEIGDILKPLSNITTYYPTEKGQMKSLVPEFLNNGNPSILILRR